MEIRIERHKASAVKTYSFGGNEFVIAVKTEHILHLITGACIAHQRERAYHGDEPLRLPRIQICLRSVRLAGRHRHDFRAVDCRKMMRKKNVLVGTGRSLNPQKGEESGG